MPKVLVVDNRDSFVYTIIDYLRTLGADCEVRRAETVRACDVRVSRADGVLLSPGPGRPDEASACREILAEHAGAVPILGVCLGHQVIAEAYGARVVRAGAPVHGETATLTHDGTGVFTGLPDPFTVTRYHSLTVDPATVAGPLRITATTDDGVVMGLRHEELAVEGVQFHPEAVLSEHGHRLLGNWVAALLGARCRRRRSGRPQGRPLLSCPIPRQAGGWATRSTRRSGFPPGR
ncbi:aminodeoxychorismate/anthranilate synthase component II [Phytomonospora sp. NPDC050363]|uniref:anthranilate synthase component II n=1 Tax=Phytomonospora sp. NPDC050363 TaxID=3155642 RepID=UPI0033E4FA03